MYRFLRTSCNLALRLRLLNFLLHQFLTGQCWWMLIIQQKCGNFESNRKISVVNSAVPSEVIYLYLLERDIEKFVPFDFFLHFTVSYEGITNLFPRGLLDE